MQLITVVCVCVCTGEKDPLNTDQGGQAPTPPERDPTLLDDFDPDGKDTCYLAWLTCIHQPYITIKNILLV